MIFDNLSQITFCSRIVLLCSLIILNLILKLRTLKAELNFDTASHLYYGFLEYNNIHFRSSYTLGIKIFLPFLYSKVFRYLDKKFYRFRWLNILSSTILIVLLFLFDSIIYYKEIPFYILFILLINSHWINQHTSAAEFHSDVLLLMTIAIAVVSPGPFSWYLSLFLLAINVIFSKFLYIIYVFPIAFFCFDSIFQNLFHLSIGLIIILLCGVKVYLLSYSNAKKYSSNRSIVNKKNIRFIIKNPVFIVLMFYFLVNNITQLKLEWVLMHVVILFVFLIQRSYLGYFYYSIVVFSFFSSFQNELFLRMDIRFAFATVAYVFFMQTLLLFIYRPEDQEIVFRTKVMGEKNYPKSEKMRKEQIYWLTKNITEDNRVYLWGSNVSLLLLSNLKIIEGTFYNHNHLFYWSTEDDPVEYAVQCINDHDPEFIIEASPMFSIGCPIEKLRNRFSRECVIGNMTVYKTSRKV